MPQRQVPQRTSLEALNRGRRLAGPLRRLGDGEVTEKSQLNDLSLLICQLTERAVNPHPVNNVLFEDGGWLVAVVQNELLLFADRSAMFID